MKRNKFFGDTVQKLDYLCENVTTILASRVPSRINKQSLNSSGTLQLGQSGKFNLKSPHGGQPSIHGQAFLQLSKYPYYHALRVILRKTRKSFILSHYNIRSEAYSDSRIVADAVDEKEVKRFLTNPHYNNFTYTEDSLSTIYARSYFFNMLTGGALRELETLAFNIVNNEKKHYNFIVQPKSSKNNANNKHALNSSGSDIVVGYDDDMFEGSEAFF